LLEKSIGLATVGFATTTFLGSPMVLVNVLEFLLALLRTPAIS